MINRDYITLSKDLLSNDKKQIKNIKGTLVSSSVLLILVIYVMSSLFIGALKSLDEDGRVASISLDYMDSPSYGINTNYFSDIVGNENVKDFISYDSIYISYYNESSGFLKPSIYHYPTLNIGGDIYKYDKHKVQDTFTFFDMKRSSCLISIDEENYLQNNGYGKGIIAGDSFSENINEVILGQDLLDYLGLDYDLVIGKTISYNVDLSNNDDVYYNGENITDKYAGTSVCLFQNYVIVGVYNSRINSLPTRFNGTHQISSMFWFKDESRFTTDQITLEATNPVKINEHDIMYDYTFIYNKSVESLIDEAHEKQQVFLPSGFSTGLSIESKSCSQFLYFNNFLSAYRFIDVLDKYEELSCPNKGYSDSYSLNQNLITFVDLYPYFEYSFYILLVFSAILILITIINIIRIINYSVRKNRHFLMICKVLGLQSRDISKMYFIQITYILIKSLIRIIIISLLVTLVTMLLINRVLNSSYFIGEVAYSLSFIYYPIAILIVMIFIAFLVYLTTYIGTRRVNRLEIVDVLKSE